MAPVKTPKTSTSSQPSGSSKTTYNHKHAAKSKQRHSASEVQRLPGVQKIKASLRQTRRLLAKDNLAANVRVETERRLHALEKDLVEAQRIQKERAMATRYHKVKFFERQKVLRKISQIKRDLEACSNKKDKKQMKKSLFSLRVDLNYVLHYPKVKKYISLFPSETRHGEGTSSMLTASEDVGETVQESSTTNIQREDTRRWIKERMERGDLSSQPELEQSTSSETSHASRSVPGLQGVSEPKDAGKSRLREYREIPKASTINKDGFFGDDNDDDQDD